MFNQIFVVVVATVLLATASAAPEAKPEAKPLVVAAAPVAYTTAPFVSAPVVTATSSQAIVRNYNGLAVSAPLVAAAAAPYAAYTAYSAYSPFVAYPYAHPAAAYVAAASPYAAGVQVVV